MYIIGALFLLVTALGMYSCMRSARESMLWTSVHYFLFLVGAFALGRVLFLWGVISVQFVPDYWHPTTLFNLGALT